VFTFLASYTSIAIVTTVFK